MHTCLPAGTWLILRAHACACVLLSWACLRLGIPAPATSGGLGPEHGLGQHPLCALTCCREEMDGSLEAEGLQPSRFRYSREVSQYVQVRTFMPAVCRPLLPACLALLAPSCLSLGQGRVGRNGTRWNGAVDASCVRAFSGSSVSCTGSHASVLPC